MNATMYRSRLSVLVSALALLGGCVAVPVEPGYYTDSSGYYGPAPVYVAPPVYYGPPVVFFGSRTYVRPHAGGGGHGGKRGGGSGRGSGHGRR
jgi:hypothetical protein